MKLQISNCFIPHLSPTLPLYVTLPSIVFLIGLCRREGSEEDDQHARMKEEQLRKEEEKLREIELKVERELKEKQQELWAKEQQLQTLEAQQA